MWSLRLGRMGSHRVARVRLRPQDNREYFVGFPTVALERSGVDERCVNPLHITLMTLVPLRRFDLPQNQNHEVRPEPPELREVDLTRVHEALRASIATSTLKVYACLWRLFEAWCHEHGHTPLPAHPATVAAYLAERAASGIAASSLSMDCCAINRRHRDHDLPSPTNNEAVRRVRRGLARIHGATPRRPAHPLNPEQIRRILNAIDRTTIPGIRDAALILIGFASAMRVSELANLHLADLRPQRGGLILHIRASKTDTERKGAQVGVAAGSHPDTDPLTALDAWLSLRGDEDGPLFTNLSGVHRSGRIRIEPITGKHVSEIVHQRAEAAGLPAERITGHSLRAGHATTAALAGVPAEQIALQTRHRQIDVLIRHYIRPALTLQRSSSQHLGL